MPKPLVIELFAGSFGWSAGFLAEGYRSVGFDIVHEYYHGPVPNGAELVLQDVLTLHGSQFRDATCIVASPPCQKYSYMAMPWKRAKALIAWQRESPERVKALNALFDACFRIQYEACESAGRYIPMVVENVKGAQPWVGRAKWHYGSYYLWGDVPALMPITFTGAKIADTGSWFYAKDNPDAFCWRNNHHTPPGLKVPGIELSQVGFNCAAAQRYKEGTKQHGSGEAWFDKAFGERRKEATAIKNRKDRPDYPYSPGDSRKAASTQIAKIPLPLSLHIARCFKPQ